MRYSLLLFSLLLSSTYTISQSWEDYDSFTEKQKKVNIDGYEMAYIDEGEGPVILLVHGVPSSGWVYIKMIDPLVQAGFRVIAPDMLGMGQSTVNQESPIGIKDQGKALSTLVSKLDISHCYLAVHDAGGPWAWAWLSDSKTKIDGLFLLNTILYMEGFNPPMRLSDSGIKYGLTKWAYTKTWIAKMIVKTTLKKGTEKVDLSKSDKAGYLQPLENHIGATVVEFLSHFDELEMWCEKGQTYLKENNVPICAIWGEKDPFLIGQKQLPIAMKELNLKPLNTHILGGCSHFIQEEAPKEIVSFMVQFVRTNGQ